MSGMSKKQRCVTSFMVESEPQKTSSVAGLLFAASLSDAGSQSDGVLLGDTHVHELPSGCQPSVFGESHDGGCSCRDAYHAAVFFHLLQQVVGS